jgi:cytochrome b
MRNRIAIWDLPTRAFHWLVVLLIPAMWWTAEEEMMDLHIVLGQVMLGLVLFRIFWGLVGGSTARFASFVKGPRAILAYLRGERDGRVGHNPLGALSVVAILMILAAQVGLGLFASDEDGLDQGPLSHHVGFDTAETLADRHDTMFDILLVFIGLHLAAILFYRFVKRDDLITPMVTGGRAGVPGERAMVEAPAWRFFIAAGLALALTLWIGTGL